ncbi:MAG: type I pantothenate kinase [Lactobacillales bacterium]|jgi:type I pantothenate kinase|nr:type I pantothenate kinase [Lactobacillales bacterium]
MNIKNTFHEFSRENWKKLSTNAGTALTSAELEKMKSIGDVIDLDDVVEVYLPLVKYIEQNRTNYLKNREKKNQFLDCPCTPRAPFIIGIAGSVAVGKTTVARLLKELLSETHTVEMITTDGFLYPNEELARRGIMSRKGFPESYDMRALMDFLSEVKLGRKAYAPTYSHEQYDVIENEKIVIDSPDILIVEGINVFQLPTGQHMFMSEFFDFNIYVDASVKNIEKWYVERFEALLNSETTSGPYLELAAQPREKAIEHAYKVWQTVNLVNLLEYIEPTKPRADAIVHKGAGHFIDKILIKKY